MKKCKCCGDLVYVGDINMCPNCGNCIEHVHNTNKKTKVVSKPKEVIKEIKTKSKNK